MEYSIAIDWLIIIITFIITLGSQAYINAQYDNARRIKTLKGKKGAEIAREILDANNLTNVRVEETYGKLNDHYDPRKKVVRLSSEVYNETSAASAAVAAHECGHAIQDKKGYIFLKVRNSIVPIVNLSSTLGYFAIIIGLFTGALGFIRIGIILELVILIFQIITLPVEFDASKRGLENLENLDMITKKEKTSCKGMLLAAALTYVASVATSVLQILRLIMMVRRDDDR